MADPDTRFTELAVFENEFEASVIASILEDAGIPAKVVGGHLDNLGPMATGHRVRVAVAAADAERADEILRRTVERATDRRLALTAEGACVNCGQDMSERVDQEVCAGCGVNLRALAERLREYGPVLSMPEGQPRISGRFGRIVSRIILVFFGIPFAAVLTLTLGGNPWGAALAVAVIAVLLAVILLRWRRT